MSSGPPGQSRNGHPVVNGHDTGKFGGFAFGGGAAMVCRVQGRGVDGLRAAVAGIGLCQIPGFMAAEAFAQGLLVEVLGPYRPPEIPISICYLNHKFVAPRVEVFVKFLLDHQAHFVDRGPIGVVAEVVSPDENQDHGA